MIIRTTHRNLQDRSDWVCLCDNASHEDGFYPVNALGEMQLHLWQGNRQYACFRCGRVIDNQTLQVIGVTPYHKLTGKELVAVYANCTPAKRNHRRQFPRMNKGLRRAWKNCLAFSLACLFTGLTFYLVLLYTGRLDHVQQIIGRVGHYPFQLSGLAGNPV